MPPSAPFSTPSSPTSNPLFSNCIPSNPSTPLRSPRRAHITRTNPSLHSSPSNCHPSEYLIATLKLSKMDQQGVHLPSTSSRTRPLVTTRQPRHPTPPDHYFTTWFHRNTVPISPTRACPHSHRSPVTRPTSSQPLLPVAFTSLEYYGLPRHTTRLQFIRYILHNVPNAHLLRQP